MTRTQKSAIDKIMEEHRELRGIVADTRKFLVLPRPAPEDEACHEWASTLAERLISLHDKVYRHFREEEESGALVDLERQHPRSGPEVRRMYRQHKRILSGFRELLSAAMVYAEGETPTIARLRQKTCTVLDRLEEHEAAETELIQRLYYEDLGQVD